MLLVSRRPEECLALLRHALDIALEHDLAAATLRAYFNLGYVALQRERWDEGARYLESGLALARTRGERAAEWRSLANLIDFLQYAGDWDDALARAAELPEEALDVPQVGLNIINPLTRIHTSRGDLAAALALVDDPRPSSRDATTADMQLRAGYTLAVAVVRRAEGRFDEALAAAEEALSRQQGQGNAFGMMESVVEAVEAALELGRVETAEELLARVENLDPGTDTQSLHAQRRRLGARIAAGRGDREKAEHGFKRAAGAFREIAVPFWLGVTLLEYGEWLAGEGRATDADPLLLEAREIFERLGAKPWLARLDGLRTTSGVAA
jgi:tetratricopeptide (TPR) repeat protein